LQKQKTPTFPEGQPYFARIEDAGFLADKERIKVLIDLNEYYECLYEVQYDQFKNISEKKKPPKSKLASILDGQVNGFTFHTFRY